MKTGYCKSFTVFEQVGHEPENAKKKIELISFKNDHLWIKSCQWGGVPLIKELDKKISQGSNPTFTAYLLIEKKNPNLPNRKEIIINKSFNVFIHINFVYIFEDVIEWY